MKCIAIKKKMGWSNDSNYIKKYNKLIDINDNITDIDAGKYDAEVITGAKISMENGLIIPPVRNNKKPNCNVSKSK